MEATDDVVLEAVGLYLGPVLQLIGGDILDVAGNVEARVGIGAVGTDGCHQLVILVGDRELGGFVRDAVDLAVDSGTLSLIGLGAIHLEECLYLVEQGFLFSIVLCAEALRALEHQVLEIVSQPRSFGRVVLTTHAHRDVGLYARSLLVHGQVHLQSIVEGVDTALHRVAVDCLVATLRVTRGEQKSHHRYRQHRRKNLFHTYYFMCKVDLPNGTDYPDCPQTICPHLLTPSPPARWHRLRYPPRDR